MTGIGIHQTMCVVVLVANIQVASPSPSPWSLVAKLVSGSTEYGEDSGETLPKNAAGVRRPQMKKLRNMGAYCHSHGFHPAGEDHTSATCSWKKEGHKDEATWTNRMGGDEFWPTAKRVATAQQEHTTWKGKAAPTN